MALASSSSSPVSTASFYESIYHLKKMFPKLDLEVIESVLRSNNSSVDESIDHLLAMSVDLDDECKAESSKFVEMSTWKTTTTTTAGASSLLSDQPPSYFELMSKFRGPPPIDDDDDDNVSVSTTATIKRPTKHERIMNKLNSVLVGRLPRDFLRVKLSSDQLRGLRKCDEYKDKYKSSSRANQKSNHEYYDEIPALREDSISRRYTENCESLRDFQEIRLNSRDLDLKQDLEDEYLAMLLQNEEFISYLKTDKDFISTLKDDIDTTAASAGNKATTIDFDYKPHQDADYGYGADSFDKLMNNNLNFLNSKYSLATISNEEFKMRLFRMGKASQIRFLRLARMFAKKFKITRLNRLLNQNSTLMINNEIYTQTENASNQSKATPLNTEYHY